MSNIRFESDGSSAGRVSSLGRFAFSAATQAGR